jgi:hypothetical protein
MLIHSHASFLFVMQETAKRNVCFCKELLHQGELPSARGGASGLVLDLKDIALVRGVGG